MTRALRSISSEPLREEAIYRRGREKKGGLGYLSALDIISSREVEKYRKKLMKAEQESLNSGE